jgi:hypothetical protein
MKGSVTLLVAGYKGKSLSTHIDVLSYGKTCRAKGIPSLPEFRSVEEFGVPLRDNKV